VVINELMYHPPGSLDDLQYVEVYNPGPTNVDLSGWRLSGGIRFAFPSGARLETNACLVVARRLRHFVAHYGSNVPVVGDFEGRLKHSGEAIELLDAQGRSADRVPYSDRDPWPTGADGYSASLERICANAPGDLPENWDSSPLPKTEFPSGTPGQRNQAARDQLPPLIRITHSSAPQPGETVVIQAEVSSLHSEVQSVQLHYAIAQQGRFESEQELRMSRVAGNARHGTYQAVLPGQPEGTLLRCRVSASDVAGERRWHPSTNSPCPTLTMGLFANTNRSHLGFICLWNFEPPQREGRFTGPNGVVVPADPCRGNGAMVYIPPANGAPLVFDHVRIRQRKGGWKVHFQRDHLFLGMRGINLIFEGPPRQALSEPLAFDLFARCGVPAPQTDHVRLWVDGRCHGYQVLVEQPNRHFLERHGHDGSGHLYKLNWTGRNLIAQHEKKTRLEDGHADLTETVQHLNTLRGAAQWEYIRTHFNVDEFASYFAVSICIQNWDGFWNNYYVYHDTERTGKWEIYPWDLDKTWGDYDGVSWARDWYTMPLSYGMNLNGTAPFNPFNPAHWRQRDRGGPWWRRPGHFSGPLLANAEFRRRFLDRLEAICQKEFTESSIFPLIARLEERLRDEVQTRAQLRGRDPAAALEEFQRHLESLRRQVTYRRDFILKELPAERARIGQQAASPGTGWLWQILWFALGLVPLCLTLVLVRWFVRPKASAHLVPPPPPATPGGDIPPVLSPPAPPAIPPPLPGPPAGSSTSTPGPG